MIWQGNDLGTPVSVVLVAGASSPPPDGTSPQSFMMVGHGSGIGVVLPPRIGEFLRVHSRGWFICHGAGEFHWRINELLPEHGESTTQQVLWTFISEGRLIDVSLMDQLVRLAESGTASSRRFTLQQLDSWSALPPRMSVTEQNHLLRDVATDPSFESGQLQSALRDLDTIRRVYCVLYERFHSLATTHGVRTHGGLAMTLETQTDVAMAHIRHRGLRLSEGGIKRLVDAFEVCRDDSLKRLKNDKSAEQWLNPDYPAKGGPIKRKKKLQTWLKKASGAIRGTHQTEVLPPLGSGGEPTSEPEDWRELCARHGRLQAWFDLMAAHAQKHSCIPDGASRIHPSYEPLPLAHSPSPIFDFLRRVGASGVFVPEPGYCFVIARLVNLQLRALAAHCLNSHGHSTLAELFARSECPYAFAAERLSEPAPSDLSAELRRDSLRLRAWNVDMARSLLSLVPAGFDIDRIGEAIQATPQGESVSLATVSVWCGQLSGIFPELNDYLRDDTLEVMATNLGMAAGGLQVKLNSLWGPATPPSLTRLRSLMREYPRLKDSRTKECLRNLLTHHRSSEIQDIVRDDKEGVAIYRSLFGRTVVASTGAVRGLLPFGPARAAMHQGVADAAAKRALFELVAAGNRVVAFDNDAIVIETTESSCHANAERIHGEVRRAATSILGAVEADCDVTVASSW